MSKDMNLALTLSLNDRLVGPLKRALDNAKQAIGDTGSELQNIVRTGGKAADALAQVGQKGREAGSRAAGELREIGKAAEQAEQRVGRLRATIGQLSNLGGKAAALFGGAKAAQAVLAGPRDRAQAYELDLAKLSNVLYNDRRTVAGRQLGQGEMDMAVRRASLEGVTREEALTGLRVVGAAGGIDRKDAMAMLPTLAKFSVAGEASMEDVAALAVKSMKTYDIQPQQLPKILEMALVSGQMGNFEFKDMAKWLPQQMAMSKGMLGMSGVGDFGTLLAVNQLASNAAGGNAEAGNNVVNFLGKINAAETQKAFAKSGVNLSGSLAQARGRGVGQVDAFLNLMELEFAKDKNYTALQGKLKAARAGGDKGGEAEALEAMRGIFAGSVLSELMPDRQAQMGLVGVLNNRAGLAALKKEAQERVGEADLSQQTLMATSAMKDRIADSAEQARQFDALKDVNSALADFRLKVADLSGKYPEAAKWLEALTLAAQAAAAGLAVFGLGNVVTRLATGGGMGGGAGAIGAAGGVLGRAGAVGLAGVAALGVGSVLYQMSAGTKTGDMLGELSAQAWGFLGSKDAKEAIASTRQYEAAQALMEAAEKMKAMPQVTMPPLTITLDGVEIFNTVDQIIERVARRQ